MSVVCQDGFDFYNGTGANVGSGTRWTSFTGGIGSNSMTAGRFGGQAMRTNATGGYLRCRRLLPATYASVTVAFAHRLTSMVAASRATMWLMLDGATQVCLVVKTDGRVAAYSGDGAGAAGGALLGQSSPGIIFANTWHFIEFSTLIDASAGAVTIKVDGAAALTLTGQNTRPGAAGVNQVWVGSSVDGAGFVDHDDLFVLDSTASLGEARVESLRASADTATKDWLPNSGSTNSTQVDDATANGDADYVQSTNVGDHDLYELTNLSTTPTAIYAVAPLVFARKTDAATRTLAVTLQSGAVDDDGAAFNLAADYNAFSRITETDPQDGGAWTKARIDALKVGPKVAS